MAADCLAWNAERSRKKRTIIRTGKDEGIEEEYGDMSGLKYGRSCDEAALPRTGFLQEQANPRTMATWSPPGLHLTRAGSA